MNAKEHVVLAESSTPVHNEVEVDLVNDTSDVYVSGFDSNEESSSSSSTSAGGSHKKKAHPQSLKKQQQQQNATNKKRKTAHPYNPINASNPDYYFKEALRYVKPYYFVHECFVKDRWIGRSISDVFTKEFFAYTKEYYIKAIEEGRITVNGAKVGLDRVLVKEERVEHRLHRHEPPVTAKRVKIIAETDKVVVIDKQASIPVHPCGRWRHNSILHILKHEHGFNDLYPVHRLDRLTSGLLLIAKSQEQARIMDKQILSHDVKKTYLCRVDGKFPEGDVKCDKPLAIHSYEKSLMHVDPAGKPSITDFKLLNYNGSTSVVICTPKMGRKHQIRVHLKELGFPICNDPLYNEQYQKLMGISSEDDDINHVAVPLSENSTKSAETKDENYDELCQDCLVPRNDVPRQLSIWLHAWKYEGKDWKYNTELPDWAAEHFDSTVVSTVVD